MVEGKSWLSESKAMLALAMPSVKELDEVKVVVK